MIDGCIFEFHSIVFCVRGIIIIISTFGVSRIFTLANKVNRLTYNAFFFLGNLYALLITLKNQFLFLTSGKLVYNSEEWVVELIA